jgi:[ribosomal protein S18]-alanine N-acetyltransferase
MTPSSMVSISPLESPDDIEWSAQLMASSDPWRKLKRDYRACRAALENPSKECYIVRVGEEAAGFLVLDMTGPFPGYLQTICLAERARGRGIGSRAIAWAEDRIFRDSPNVFICVSSFNPDARRLYERLGYSLVGTLRGFFVDEHDELLMRKTRGSWAAFRHSISVGS